MVELEKAAKFFRAIKSGVFHVRNKSERQAILVMEYGRKDWLKIIYCRAGGSVLVPNTIIAGKGQEFCMRQG